MQLRDEYCARLYRRGVEGKYTDFKTIFKGTIRTVTAEGLLVMDGESGERVFGFKEVGMLW
jgi:hypothetical protein